MQHPGFASPPPPFLALLHRRVREHLAAIGATRYATPAVAIKGGLLASAVVAAGAAMVIFAHAPPAYIAAAAAFGLLTLLLALNIAHDAVHHSLTSRRRFNSAVHTLVCAVLGISGSLWQLRHVQSHHITPNVDGADTDLEQFPFLRLCPAAPRRWHHRWQYCYAPLAYALVLPNVIYIQDFNHMFGRSAGGVRTPGQALNFLFSKMLHIALLIAAPLLVLDVPLWQVLAGYAAMLAACSLLYALVLAGTHFVEEAQFPCEDSGGTLPGDWATHALATSLDWSPQNRVLNCLLGGLNAHATHHLLPGISHVHYPALSEIVQRTATEMGLPYQRTTFAAMLRSHFRLLHRLGRATPAATPLADERRGTRACAAA
jgi:linoleoyl-CoA desaturase